MILLTLWKVPLFLWQYTLSWTLPCLIWVYPHQLFYALPLHVMHFFHHLNFISAFFFMLRVLPVNNVELGLALIFCCLLFDPVRQLLSFNWSVYFMRKEITDMVGCRSSFSTCFFVFVFVCLFPSVSWFLLLGFLLR